MYRFCRIENWASCFPYNDRFSVLILNSTLQIKPNSMTICSLAKPRDRESVIKILSFIILVLFLCLFCFVLFIFCLLLVFFLLFCCCCCCFLLRPRFLSIYWYSLLTLKYKSRTFFPILVHNRCRIQLLRELFPPLTRGNLNPFSNVQANVRSHS